jgi:hypothetical protein
LDDDADFDVSMDKENIGEAPVKSKKKTVEETYQKLTQLEHVLLRPDTYIGSTEFQRTKVCTAARRRWHTYAAIFSSRHSLPDQH